MMSYDMSLVRSNGLKYRISEIATLLGVSSRTIKRWERSGRISVASRDPRTGWRYYTEADLAQLYRFLNPANPDLNEAAGVLFPESEYSNGDLHPSVRLLTAPLPDAEVGDTFLVKVNIQFNGLRELRVSLDLDTSIIKGVKGSQNDTYVTDIEPSAQKLNLEWRLTVVGIPPPDPKGACRTEVNIHAISDGQIVQSAKLPLNIRCVAGDDK